MTSPDRTIRELAVGILERVERDSAHSHVLLQHAYQDLTKQGKDDSLGFLTQIVKGTLEQRGKLDSILTQFLKKPMKSLDPWTRNVLRLGAFELMFLENVPEEISVNECVEVAKIRFRGAKAGFVNAVLRNIVRKKEKTPADIEGATLRELAEELSHPEWILRLWTEQLGREEAVSLARADNRKWATFLRVNTLKASPEVVQQKLQAEGVGTIPGKYSPDILQITTREKKVRLDSLASFRDGLWLVQDESAAVVGLLVDPRPGELVLDLCSAPGSKATHLAMLMQDKGLCLALDPHPRRLGLVCSLARRLRLHSLAAAAGDGRSIAFSRLMDRILVDAPCSGLGVLGNKADIRWNQREESVPDLTSLQNALLDNAANLLKPGGRLVYSTCTINTAENEDVAAAFLERNPDFTHIRCDSILPASLCTESGFYRALPHLHGTAGAFGAVFIRDDSKEVRSNTRVAL